MTLKIASIQEIVAAYYDVTVHDLKSDTRTKGLIRPRHVAMWAAKAHTGQSLPAIGTHFGRRHHTTVLHAVQKVEEQIAIDPHFAAEIAQIAEEIDVAEAVLDALAIADDEISRVDVTKAAMIGAGSARGAESLSVYAVMALARGFLALQEAIGALSAEPEAEPDPPAPAPRPSYPAFKPRRYSVPPILPAISAPRGDQTPGMPPPGRSALDLQKSSN